ncbi:23S rRNA (adenine(2058)-N(6))-methyltransferase Erm(41) [Luedemannella flava]|uniref:23S rRNA (Adenine(2058)-N(6))-methyltransferase Erm(41) n=1 Tax=Luedemannella flava TaxID=349316 RepID=A0ABN2LYK6_9ACTN
MSAGQRSRRAWGWHPLTDSWAARIVADAGIRRGDLVLDIGAGTGALTGPLLATGARVIAIELHPGRAAHLRERFAGRSLSVVEADAATLRLPGRPFHVVANPPYHLTSTLLRALFAPNSRLIGADLVLQRQAVRRFVERRAPGKRRWDLSFGRPLPRHAFRPPPQVDSAVLVIRTRGGLKAFPPNT